MDVAVRDLTDADRPWLRALVERHWGLPVVTPAAVYDTPEMHRGVVAEVAGEPAGAATWVAEGSSWEVVTVVAAVEGAGVGRRLLETVRERAADEGAARVWLVTTDDTGAAGFYERLGMTRVRTHRDFVEVVRRSKPASAGYRDAYEYAWRLGSR